MRTNSLARFLVNLPLIVKGKSTVLCVPESTLKKTAGTNNTVSLRVSKTSEKTLRELQTSSQLVATTTEGMTVVEGATIGMTTTLRTTLDTVKATMTKTGRLTTIVTKDSLM
jgi:hypothetical protein